MSAALHVLVTAELEIGSQHHLKAVLEHITKNTGTLPATNRQQLHPGEQLKPEVHRFCSARALWQLGKAAVHPQHGGKAGGQYKNHKQVSGIQHAAMPPLASAAAC